MLVSHENKGVVRKYNRQGKFDVEWEVSPSPITSVSSLREITTDYRGNIYVLDSSWEASSSLENTGSIQKFSPDGKPLFRITRDLDFIQYPQKMAVDRDENIYLLDLGNCISKFNSKGEYLFTWSVLPPEFGESWKEKQRLEKQANSTTDESGINDLITAIVYGDDNHKFQAIRNITKKGVEASPMLIQAYAEYHMYPFITMYIENIFDAWGEKGVNALRKGYRDGNKEIKKGLAICLTRRGFEEVIPTLRELMKSNNEIERICAIDELSNFPLDDELITVILGQLNDDDYSTAESSLSKQIDITLPRLIDLLADTTYPKRKKVAEILMDAGATHCIKEKRSVEMLRSLLTSSDPYVRKTAVLSLWNNGDTTFNDEVFHIAEADPDFRRVIVNAFETRKDLKCVSLLIKLVNNEKDTSDREYFLKILASIDAEKAYEVASSTIIDPHESDKMKVAALDLLSDLTAKKMHELIPMLKKAFSDSGNDNIRCRVIEILGKSGEKGIISFLWSSYEIPTSSMKVKAAALSAFGEIKDAHQLDKLWTVFQDTQEKADFTMLLSMPYMILAVMRNMCLSSWS